MPDEGQPNPELECAWDHVIRLQSNLAYIVLPPGHGKSFHHLAMEGLLEADSVYGCRQYDALAEARQKARRTGFWDFYDMMWVKRIANRLENRRQVIMVPHCSVGEFFLGHHLGTAQLKDHQWAENLTKRHKTVHDYEYARMTDPRTEYFESNDQLSEWILRLATDWINAPMS